MQEQSAQPAADRDRVRLRRDRTTAGRPLWDEQAAFRVEDVPTEGKPKYYVLEMFPYPSGSIHVGHVRNYTLGDVVARYKRACGFNVLHPMGWDAFGLPAENAARERGVHPAEWTWANIAAMRAELQRMGLSIDWSREFATCDPAYYGQQQKLFLSLMRQGLVERRLSWVNWDPVDETVLANEQVVDGRGWRSGAPVEKRQLAQWFFRITQYAPALLDALDGLDRWPDRVRAMQSKWIGRSEGARIRFAVAGEPAGSDRRGLHDPAGHAVRHVVPGRGARSSAGSRDRREQARRGAASSRSAGPGHQRGHHRSGREEGFRYGAAGAPPVRRAVAADMDRQLRADGLRHRRDLRLPVRRSAGPGFRAHRYGLDVLPVVLPPGEDGGCFAVGDKAYDGPGQIINSGFPERADRPSRPGRR